MHQHTFTSMVIFVTHIVGILAYKRKRNAPVATYLDRPRAPAIASQLMQR
jgi:hypothetical protein